MAAISATTQLKTRQATDALSMLVLDAVSTYKGARCKINGPTHGTSAHQGRVEGIEATIDEGSIPWGVFDKGGTGTSGALVGAEASAVQQVCNLDRYVREGIAVTGASAQTDVGKIVYYSNNNDLTLTRPTTGIPAGVIAYYYSSTSFDVVMFGAIDMVIIAISGSGQDVICLGNYLFASVADGNILTSFPAPYHGKIISLYAHVGAPLVGSGGTGLVNAEIDGTNLTGGVITVSSAAGGTAGAILQGSAVTDDGANVFHEGDLIDLEIASAGGTRTSGTYTVYAQIERLPGV